MPATDVASQPVVDRPLWQPPLAARFETIWKAHSARIQAACRGWMRQRPDLVDEAYSRVSAAAFERFMRAGGSVHTPLGWLLVLTRNTCIDLHREQRRDPLCGAEVVENAGLAGPGDIEQSLMGRQLAAHVGRWIEELPPLQGEALRLKVLHGWSYPEMAERLGITQANARKRVQQARGRLRRRLDQYRGASG